VQQYLHHVPGRLRIRSPLLKRNETAAADAAKGLVARPGVTSVKTNALTGSVTIVYDARWCDVAALLDHLRLTGHLAMTPQPQLAAAADKPDALVQALALSLIRSVGEKLIERSAMAVVAAII
jgi:hypothetical protein